MKLVVNNKIIQKLNEEFPSLKKNRFKKDNDNGALRAYFNNYEENYRYIMSLENLKKNENIHDYDFFEKLFDVCNIILNKSDLDTYLKDLFNDDYKLIMVKTTIPSRKYDLNNQDTILGLKQILLAVKTSYDIDLDYIYTPKDIVLLQNQNVIRYIATGDNYQQINGADFLKLNKEYQKTNITPMEVYNIDRLNYLCLLNNYPHLFAHIRDNLTFEMISELLLEYEELLSGVVNSEINDCNKMISKSLNRIDDINRMHLKY